MNLSSSVLQGSSLGCGNSPPCVPRGRCLQEAIVPPHFLLKSET
jgi:hypothetical protein